jgi:hypothetical protein
MRTGRISIALNAVAFATSPARALDVAEPRGFLRRRHRSHVWAEVGTKLEATPRRGTIYGADRLGLLHRQPSLNSIATAEEHLGQRWLAMESAVAALACASGRSRQ